VTFPDWLHFPTCLSSVNYHDSCISTQKFPQEFIEWKCSEYYSFLKERQVGKWNRSGTVTGSQMSRISKCHGSANVTGRQLSLGAKDLHTPLENGYGGQMPQVGNNHIGKCHQLANVTGRQMSGWQKLSQHMTRRA